MPVLELTDRFCRAVKPGSEPQIAHYDELVTGLALMVSRGGKVWYLRYSRPGDGRRAWLRLGRFPQLGLAQARRRAKEAREAITEGRDPLIERRARASAQTVKQLVENYVERHASTRRSGPAIARRLRRNVSDAIGDVKLADLHRRDLTKAIDKVVDRGAPVEANRVFEDLRAMVRWARGRGDLDENLVEGMRRPTETRPRERALDAVQIAAFWRGLDGADMRESTKRALRLCLVTAQRVGEVAGMTRAELDLDKAIWTIPAARTKNAREHTVPLSELALEIIREQIADAADLARRKRRPPAKWVFPGPGARAALTGSAVATALARCRTGKDHDQRLFGMEVFTPHDLRRSAATGMETLGISPFVIGHVLNHVSVTRAGVTSRVYARYSYDREKREALDAWAARLAGMVEGGATVVLLAARVGL